MMKILGNPGREGHFFNLVKFLYKKYLWQSLNIMEEITVYSLFLNSRAREKSILSLI